MTNAMSNFENNNAPSTVDPKFTFTDWDNFNPSQWYAIRKDCHNFGDITVIENSNNPMCKLFIAKELADIFGYSGTSKLTQLITRNSNSCKNYGQAVLAQLNEIKDLGKIFADQGKEINPQGLNLVNYAGFNNAIMHSKKPNAKIIQSYVYGSILPSVQETGKFESNTQLTNDNPTSQLTVNINADNIVQQLLSKIDESNSILYSQLEYVNNNILENNNQLRQLKSDMLQIKSDVDWIKSTLDKIRLYVSKIIGAAAMFIPYKKFSIPTVVVYLNEHYKDSEFGDCTVESITNFMKTIGLLNKNNLINKNAEKNDLIMYNFDPKLDEYYNIMLTKKGVEYLIQKLEEYQYITVKDI